MSYSDPDNINDPMDLLGQLGEGIAETLGDLFEAFGGAIFGDDED